MWFSAIKLAVNAGSHIYKKKQETRMNIASAQAVHAEKMATGELEYKRKLLRVMIMVGRMSLYLYLYLFLFCYWSGVFFLTIRKFVLN